MGYKLSVLCSGAIATAMLLASLLFIALPTPAAAFWDGFPFAPTSDEQEDSTLSAAMIERLCDRQAALSGRLFRPLIDQALCDGGSEEPEEPTVSISADPMTIQVGGSSTLEWDSENADSCEASGGWSGDKNLSGSQSVSPTVTTTYTIICEGEGGTDTDSVTVTVNAAPQTATLTLVKTVVNDDGGTATTSSFQGKIDGTNVSWGVAHAVSVGTHTASESGITGYTAGSWGGDCASDGSVTLAAGQNKTCTITNDDQPGTLRVVKVIVNDNGGSSATSSFSFKINDGSATAFESDGSNDVTVDAGAYTVTEVAASGYSTSYSNCSNVVVSNGETETCTITNNDNPVTPTTATLTLVKTVVNNNGGTTTPSAWTLSADGPTDFSGVTGSTTVTNVTVNPGVYTLSESGGASGYTASQYSCVKNGGAPVIANSITLAAGDTATCTITNDDLAGMLIVKKVVIRDNGNNTATTSFAFQVDGGTATAFEADGQNDLARNAGTYSVTEVAVDGFTTTYDNCANVFVPNGGSATCTITNNDVAVAPTTATLTLVKNVTNNNGGTTTPSAWTLSADGPTDFSGLTGSTTVTNVVVDPGVYTLSESGGPSGYTASSYSCVKNGGSAVDGNSITLAAGDTATCTITNDDLAGTLIVKKVVVNDNGGSTATSTFTFRVNGGSAIAFEVDGENSMSVNAGTYDVTEPAVEGYTTTYENCTGVFVHNGGSATCTITNNDVAETPEGALLITEVLYDIATTTQGVETTDEWVEIYNGTSGEMDLSGYALKDNASTTADVFPEGTILPAGAFLIVVGTSTTPDLWDFPEGTIVLATADGDIGGNGLSNGGDVVGLYDESDALVDAVSWGTNTSAFDPSVPVVAEEGSSIARISNTTDTDTAADWEENETPNPGE